MASIIDGNVIAAQVRASVASRVASLKGHGITPGLAVILVGDDPASHSYVTMKERDCQEVGIASRDLRRPADISQEQLESLIDECNNSAEVHGILLQLPLPSHLDAEAAIARIDPSKDVDGFHPVNLGRLLRGLPAFRACTPWGIMKMLVHHGIELQGKEAVVVGRSTIVGKPMALMLLERNATVTVCHSRTHDLAAVCRRADILVAAVGRAEMITEEFVKPGAVVIDVGINRTDTGMVGDVDFARVEPIASAITPVPGGVGPMTRAMLLSNTLDAVAGQTGGSK
ncbi:MAG: bifunctional methylenetetrahydrofolate dehydrogenase/methenyltetrahydrofolate cyclohydrolase FolD [Actinobacteria bacterium]|nr:bifunctional methylenetetrahydrofolate dehydrogenase/methenyltetrahydrofolate cyclohydrolase FolD [Actinomycetota bacterium]MCL5886826.1 bifunctional methylenetetrahydrofolate dehydrogenase/methenyltetrahydrofolate cyclohydrolase FolD [Actinomycetota bacterium]